MLEKQKVKFIGWILEGNLKGKKFRQWMAAKYIAKEINRMDENDSKKWYQSKTLWFNALSGISGVLTALAAPEVMKDPKIVGVFVSINGLINMILRMITDKPVTK